MLLVSGRSEYWRSETNLGDQRERRKAGNIQVCLYYQPGGSFMHLSTPGSLKTLVCFQMVLFGKILMVSSILACQGLLLLITRDLSVLGCSILGQPFIKLNRMKLNNEIKPRVEWLAASHVVYFRVISAMRYLWGFPETVHPSSNWCIYLDCSHG